MPIFFYKAKNFNGQYISGKIEEKNEKELASSLRKDGYILISAKKEDKSKKKRIEIPFLNKVSIVEKIVFIRNLKVLISAGVSLPRAMKILAKQTKSKKFKKVIFNINEKLTKGISLSEALSYHNNVFPDIFCSMIKAGEESGTIENSLDILVQQMEKNHELKQKVKGALIYPSIIIIAMILIGILMIIVIVPKLSETFEELEIELPASTRFVVKMGLLFSNYWYLLIAFLIALPFFTGMVIRTKTGKKIIDTFFLKIPILSSFIKKVNSAHIVRTLSSLMSSGVPIVKSLEIASETSGNTYYKKALMETSEEMKKGSKLAEGLGKHEKIFSSLVIQMIEVGEETGETSSILKKLADFYEEEIANITKNLSSVIEPILMIFVGIAVGFFAISMIQPIYGILGSI